MASASKFLGVAAGVAVVAAGMLGTLHWMSALLQEHQEQRAALASVAQVPETPQGGKQAQPEQAQWLVLRLSAKVADSGASALVEPLGTQAICPKHAVTPSAAGSGFFATNDELDSLVLERDLCFPASSDTVLRDSGLLRAEKLVLAGIDGEVRQIQQSALRQIKVDATSGQDPWYLSALAIETEDDVRTIALTASRLNPRLSVKLPSLDGNGATVAVVLDPAQQESWQAAFPEFHRQGEIEVESLDGQEAIPDGYLPLQQATSLPAPGKAPEWRNAAGVR